MTTDFRQRLLASTFFIGAAVFAAPVAAQTADPQAAGPTDAQAATTAEPQADDTGDNDVVVTGSRITSPNVVSNSPVTTVSSTILQATSRVSVGDTLNTLPQMQSTFSQANSTRFLGTAGLNLIDLRGLGTQRTLVLVNGRRHVGSDILNNAVSVDINTIPTDLIESVDVLTGGESAVYGSDAIAGVVNFRLKQNFEGVQGRVQGGVSGYGDAGSYFASVLAGKNFAEGRGNIAVNVEYARQNSLYASERGYLQRNDGFVVVDSDPAGVAPGQSLPNYDGIPDAVFVRDIRSATISAGGLVSIGGQAGQCGRDATGRTFSCNYLFRPDGTLVQETGARIGIGTNSASPSSSSFLGGNGDTRREGQLVQIQPQLDRISANLVGHFDVSPAFVPFVEAKYSRTRSVGQGGSGPAFFAGGTLDGFYEQPELANPYLSDQARGLLSQQFLAQVDAGYNPSSGTALQGTPEEIAEQQAELRSQIADGSYRFIVRKNLTDLGVRTERALRETYRIVGGVRGTFNSDWKYEVSANYGEFKERTQVLGNLNQQRALLALDAVRDPVSGAIVCGSQLDPTRAYDDFGGNPAVLAADIAACKPLNPFGTGNISQEAKNYVLQDTTSVGKITQLDISAFVNGDSSGFLNLPGGPVSFVVGGEYRRETNFFKADPLVEAGYTFYNALPTFNPPSFEVKEAYGEILVPVLADLPFAHKLTLTAAARVSDYNSAAGTVGTYNFGASYAPIPDITFRGSYARAVRAPNLVELYSEQGQNFATVTDPCSAIAIGTGTQYRAANCAAAGIPTSYDYRYQSSLEFLSGGNPDLKVEQSDSYTVGVLIAPRFTRGLSLSVDYYDITVNNVITSPGAQQILNSCYDAPTTDNQFCGLFQRVGAGQVGPNGEEAFRVIEGSLQATLLNYASLKVRGLDVNLNYVHDFGPVKISSTLSYTHQFQNDAFIDPSQPGFADLFVGEVGTPQDKAFWNINGDFGPLNLNYQVRYLSKMAVPNASGLSIIENHISANGAPPQNKDDFDIPFYPEVLYMDARLGINISDGSQFYIGADNLTNRRPPLGSTAIGGGTGVYESIGRRYYAGFSAKF